MYLYNQLWLVFWFVDYHLLLLRKFGPYRIIFICVLLLPISRYGDYLLLKIFWDLWDNIKMLP